MAVHPCLPVTKPPDSPGGRFASHHRVGRPARRRPRLTVGAVRHSRNAETAKAEVRCLQGERRRGPFHRDRLDGNLRFESTTASITENAAPARALTPNRYAKPMEQPQNRRDDGQVRRCLRPWVPTASVGGRRESGTMYASPAKRCAKPVNGPRSPRAMIAVRRCLRAEAGGLGIGEADFRHEVHFTQKPLWQADETAPEPRSRLS